MFCIYRSKANFAENMANNVKKKESESPLIYAQKKAKRMVFDE